MSTRRAVAIVFLSTAGNVAGGDLQDNEAVFAGGRAESDGLWVSGPSLYLRKNVPAVLAAMIQAPEKDRGYAYVFLVKGDEQRKEPANFVNGCSISRPIAKSSGSLEIAKKKLSFVYQAELDQSKTPPLKETLSINGKMHELGRGRVFLVDLKGDDVSVKQAGAPLPAAPPLPTETSQVESQAKKLLEHLRRGDHGVRELLK